MPRPKSPKKPASGVQHQLIEGLSPPRSNCASINLASGQVTRFTWIYNRDSVKALKAYKYIYIEVAISHVPLLALYFFLLEVLDRFFLRSFWIHPFSLPAWRDATIVLPGSQFDTPSVPLFRVPLQQQEGGGGDGREGWGLEGSENSPRKRMSFKCSTFPFIWQSHWWRKLEEWRFSSGLLSFPLPPSS